MSSFILTRRLRGIVTMLAVAGLLAFSLGSAVGHDSAPAAAQRTAAPGFVANFAVLGALHESVDDATDDDEEPLSEEAAADLLADLREACGPDVQAPDLSGLTEDQAEDLLEPLIEACEDEDEDEDENEDENEEEDEDEEDGISDEDLADLVADLREACGSNVQVPNLTGLSESRAERVVERLIEACEDADDARDGDDDDDEDDEDEDEDDDDEDDEDEDDDDDD